MNASLISRLDRLEGYLQQDPDNLTLVGEAFDTALSAGDWARAEPHLRRAQVLSDHAAGWVLREGHWLLAQHKFAEARAVLLQLQALRDLARDIRPLVAHDLAYIALREGNPEPGLLELTPWVEVPTGQGVDEALQVLWLRLMHHARRLDAALAWARARSEAGQLATAAAGVASLLALDAEDFQTCLRWSDQALKAPGAPVEALVARASVALAQKAPGLSRQLLQRALQLNPTDGRTWSALGYADLMEMRLDSARKSFANAVQTMPRHIGTWHGLAWACLIQGDVDAARQAFDQAMALDRNFAETHGGMAVVLATQQQREAAEASIQRALRLDRNSLTARYAESILSGEAADRAAFRDLAVRLFGERAAPLGGTVLDLMPGLQDGPSDAPQGGEPH